MRTRLVLALLLSSLAALGTPAVARATIATQLVGIYVVNETPESAGKESIKLTKVGAQLRVDELRSDGPAIAVGSGCSGTAVPHTVFCDLTKQPAGARIGVNLFFGDDVLRIGGNLGFPVGSSGGTGDDDLQGTELGDLLSGGTGSDTLRGGLGDDTLDGGDGDDTLLGGSVSTGAAPAPDGKDTFDAGLGDDFIQARDGVAEDINCGLGNDDFAILDLKDVNEGSIKRCEGMNVADRREGPNVVIKGRRLRVTRSGAARVRLSCPRRSGGCAGKLTVHGLRGAHKTKLGSRGYHIGERHSKTVSVPLNGGGHGYKRARVTSVERGKHGPKTTIATRRLARR